jgi:hypothetical protein
VYGDEGELGEVRERFIVGARDDVLKSNVGLGCGELGEDVELRPVGELGDDAESERDRDFREDTELERTGELGDDAESECDELEEGTVINLVRGGVAPCMAFPLTCMKVLRLVSKIRIEMQECNLESAY